MSFDASIALYLNQAGIPPALTLFLANYLPYLLAVVVACALYRIGKDNRGRLLLFLEAGIAALLSRWVFVELVRLMFERPRPFTAHSDIIALFDKTSSSFPSGHAAFFCALATIVWCYNRRWGAWLFVASAIIGLARVMAGVHYPTDILGGAVLGVVVGWGVHRLFKKNKSGFPHSTAR